MGFARPQISVFIILFVFKQVEREDFEWLLWVRLLTWSIRLAGASLVVQIVKCLPTMQETWVWSLGWEDPLEKEMATHSSTLAWRIPWMEEPGGLQSIDLKELDVTEQLHYQASCWLCSKYGTPTLENWKRIWCSLRALYLCISPANH